MSAQDHIQKLLGEVDSLQAELERLRTLEGGGAYIAQVLVRLTTSQSIPHNTVTNVSWSTAVYDNASFWAAGSPTQLLIPVDGVYFLSGSFLYASNATGTRAMAITRNGTTDIARDRIQAPNNGKAGITIGREVYLYGDDIITVGAYQTSGGALNLDYDPPSAELGLTWLRGLPV